MSSTNSTVFSCYHYMPSSDNRSLCFIKQAIKMPQLDLPFFTILKFSQFLEYYRLGCGSITYMRFATRRRGQTTSYVTLSCLQSRGTDESRKIRLFSSSATRQLRLMSYFAPHHSGTGGLVLLSLASTNHNSEFTISPKYNVLTLIERNRPTKWKILTVLVVSALCSYGLSRIDF